MAGAGVVEEEAPLLLPSTDATGEPPGDDDGDADDEDQYRLSDKNRPSGAAKWSVYRSSPSRCSVK
jgi:hypothetical protein